MPNAPKQFNPRPPRPSAARRGYDAGHRARRAACLAAAGYVCQCPGCPRCLGSDRRVCTRMATVADHVIPHRGDRVLLEDQANHRAICDVCHGYKTRQGE